MENSILIGVIVILLMYAGYKTVKHFKGEGACCGGGSGYKPKKKKLTRIIMQKTFKIDGMHCEHCKNRVQEIINDIDGISGSVNLKRGTVLISYEKAVKDEIIKDKITRAGYIVLEIK